MPAHWEPVHDTHDPLLTTLARIWHLTDAARIPARIRGFLDERERSENMRRLRSDSNRRNGRIDDAQWQQDQQQREKFDRWLTTGRQLTNDSAAQRNSPDPEDIDALLSLAGETYRGNVTAVHPDGRISEIISSPFGALSRDRIPAPLDRVLASSRTPLLGGAALRKTYIGEDLPITAPGSAK
ncbi:hypothetical protein [Nocardia miyunensis]|uniref:hypothetical protein n=1 Tax=Nocardia miyunensis TaxID=282684 RepID=UPI000835ED9C|nr:hypothetical protein [Nocardia miyunensis]